MIVVKTFQAENCSFLLRWKRYSPDYFTTYDYSSYSQEIPNLLDHPVPLTSFLNCFSAEDKTKIVDILAKNCADKTKLQKLQDKYKKKHNQVI